MILFLCFIPATTEEQWVTSSSVQPRAVSTLELAAAVEMMARNITHFIFYFQMDASWLSIWVIIVNIECEWKLPSKAGQFIQNLICVCGIFRCETVKHLLNIELRGEIRFQSFKSYCKYWTSPHIDPTPQRNEWNRQTNVTSFVSILNCILQILFV